MAAAGGPHHGEVMLLVRADVLHRRRVDEHVAEEARAARDAGWMSPWSTMTG